MSHVLQCALQCVLQCMWQDALLFCARDLGVRDESSATLCVAACVCVWQDALLFCTRDLGVREPPDRCDFESKFSL